MKKFIENYGYLFPVCRFLLEGIRLLGFFIFGNKVNIIIKLMQVLLSDLIKISKTQKFKRRSVSKNRVYFEEYFDSIFVIINTLTTIIMHINTSGIEYSIFNDNFQMLIVSIVVVLAAVIGGLMILFHKYPEDRKCKRFYVLKYYDFRAIIQINLKIFTSYRRNLPNFFIKYVFFRRKCYGVVYLVDYENVHCNGLTGIEELSRKDSVIIFCRADDVKRIELFLFAKKIKCKVYCNIVTARTKNALDFEIVSYIGLNREKHSLFFIVSGDHGFDAAIQKYMMEKVLCFRRKRIQTTEFETSFSCYGDESGKKVLKLR